MLGITRPNLLGKYQCMGLQGKDHPCDPYVFLNLMGRKTCRLTQNIFLKIFRQQVVGICLHWWPKH